MSEQYPVKVLYLILDLSRSVYYAWCKRKPSAREMAAEVMIKHIRRVNQMSHRTYGSERLIRPDSVVLDYGYPDYKAVKGILQLNLEQDLEAIPVQLPPACTFCRQKDEMVGALVEVMTWT